MQEDGLRDAGTLSNFHENTALREIFNVTVAAALEQGVAAFCLGRN